MGITIFGMYVYSDTTYHSSIMHGYGDHRLLMSDWPYTEIPRMLKIYYMLGASYHLEGTIHHLIAPAQNDFFEMLLHHYITLVLIGCSFMTCFWNSGINVMIQMDNGDCFGGLMKAFMDFTPSWFVLLVYIALVFSWIYYRLYAYGYEVIYEGALKMRWSLDGNILHQPCMLVLLCGLFLLNVYWTILFFRMG
jgi:acyl-CoA-dependent ceramide synthase